MISSRIWPFVKIQAQYDEGFQRIVKACPSVTPDELHRYLSPRVALVFCESEVHSSWIFICVWLKFFPKEKRFTKFGGKPLVAKGFEWPEENTSFVIQVSVILFA